MGDVGGVWCDHPITAGFAPGDFVHTFGDVHLYLNHLEQAEEQLSRTPRPRPRLVVNPEVTSLFDFVYDDFKLVDYDPHPAIRAEVDRLGREMGKGGGYILAPAKALQPETPTENAAAVVEAFLDQAGVKLT